MANAGEFKGLLEKANEFLCEPGAKLLILILAGVLSLLILLGYQYLKLSRLADRRTEAGPYSDTVNYFVASGLPVSTGAENFRVPSSGAGGVGLAQASGQPGFPGCPPRAGLPFSYAGAVADGGPPVHKVRAGNHLRPGLLF